MAEVKGKLVTCDRCGTTCFLKCTGEKDMDGGFTRWNTFEALPEGWKVHYEIGQLCPECNEEYDAYDQYFYGERTAEVEDAFNRAWLHHIHVNPHHWQHWVLIEDDGDRKPIGLMIPYEYVVEMICDWWSFSFKKGNLYEIFNWYEQHKGRMILHENTRELVEEILAHLGGFFTNKPMFLVRCVRAFWK